MQSMLVLQGITRQDLEDKFFISFCVNIFSKDLILENI